VGTNHISGQTEARAIKACTPIGYIKSQHTVDKSSLKEVCMTHFKFSGHQW